MSQAIRQYQLLILFIGLSLLIYWPTRYAGFVHDFTGWYEQYRTYGFAGIWHCFGYHRLQHVMHFIQFCIYWLFDTNPIPWYIVYSTLFGLNAYYVMIVANKLTRIVGLRDKWLAIIAAALFLIHPYQVTSVVWKVCLHYLLSTLFVLIILGRLISWIENNEQWNSNRTRIEYVLLALLFVVSLFVHELTIGIPLITMAIGIVLWRSKHTLKSKLLYYILLPQIILSFLYFTSTPLFLIEAPRDKLITELNINIREQVSAVAQYASKHVLFTRHWPHPSKEAWQRALTTNRAMILLLIVGVSMASLFYYYYRRLPPNIRFAGLSLFAFLAVIIPFSGAYVSFVLFGSNDRYGFCGAAFLLMALVSFLRWLPRRIGGLLLILYASLSLIFCVKTIYYWHESAYVMNQLLDDFRWYDAKKVYVLAGPDNFQGLFMMKSNGTTMLSDHLMVRNGAWPKCEIEDVILFNMTARDNSVHVTVHNQDSLTVSCNQWGTWHWRKAIGATSFETDNYKVDLSIRDYHFKRKILEPGSVCIYQVGDRWEEIESWR